MQHKDKTLTFYENQAQDYFEHTKNLLNINELNKFIDYCGNKSRVLDIGSGSGKDLKYFIDKGLSAYGMDISSNLANLANEYSGAEVKTGTVNQIPYKNNEFHGIWASAMIHHIPKKEIHNALNEIKRVLKPNGYLYVSTKEGETEGFVPIGDHERFYAFYKLEEFSAILKDAGFNTLESYKMTSINPLRPHRFICFFAQVI